MATAAAGLATAVPILSLINDTSRTRMIKQGAEAKVYISNLLDSEPLPGQEAGPSSSVPRLDILLKHRFPKTYRHPTLSAHLTASRTTAEARALVRCARAGVEAPTLLCVDEEQGVLGLEIIHGHSVRQLLGGGSEGDEPAEVDADQEEGADDDVTLLSDEESLALMRLIGIELARMHQAHIIHGDLTTSNIMARRGHEGNLEVVLIDFGLSINSTSSEDKAVDIYVLERAFASTHPSSEHLFDQVMQSYRFVLENEPSRFEKARGKVEKGTMVGPTKWRDIDRKLKDVRLRGRKRSMVG